MARRRPTPWGNRPLGVCREPRTIEPPSKSPRDRFRSPGHHRAPVRVSRQVVRRRRAARSAADRDRPRVRPGLDGGRRTGRVRHAAAAAAHGTDQAADEAHRGGAARARHAGAAPAFDRVEQPMRVRVWKDEVDAYDMGDIAAQWFSDFLSEPGKPQQLRLVRFDPRSSGCRASSGPAASRPRPSSPTASRCWWPARARWPSSTSGWRATAMARWASSASGPTSCWPASSRTTRTASRCCTWPAEPGLGGRRAAAAGQALHPLPHSRHRPGHRAQQPRGQRHAAHLPRRSACRRRHHLRHELHRDPGRGADAQGRAASWGELQVRMNG